MAYTVENSDLISYSNTYWFCSAPCWSPNSIWLVLSRLDMTRHVRCVEPIELVVMSMSSRAVRQARHSQNAWTGHNDHVKSCWDVTSQVEFGLDLLMHQRRTRYMHSLTKISILVHEPSIVAQRILNTLPPSVRECRSLTAFIANHKTHCFQSAFTATANQSQMCLDSYQKLALHKWFT